MKKAISLTVLLLSALMLCGGKPNFTHTIRCNEEIIRSLKENFLDIIDLDGATLVELPYEITPIKGVKVYRLNSQIFFYEVTFFGNVSKITIFPAKCKVVQFDFKKKKIMEGISKSSDVDNFLRPRNLKEILAKHEGVKP